MQIVIVACPYIQRYSFHLCIDRYDLEVLLGSKRGAQALRLLYRPDGLMLALLVEHMALQCVRPELQTARLVPVRGTTVGYAATTKPDDFGGYAWS